MSKITLLHLLLTAIRTALQDSDILRQLAKLGYDARMLREGEKLGNAFGELMQKQEEAQRGAKAATRNLHSAQQELQHTYMRHVSQSRIIFKDQPEYREELGLDGLRKKALDKCLKQCKDFYYHAPAHLDVLENTISAETKSQQCRPYWVRLSTCIPIRSRPMERHRC
ncbi:hypothetical protein WJR50_14920 [Catalinimonas sp. 4WD22]|uniref:hypothetical protein n=1 Tax=Catalinimonas locisalis TaxID=3133978 RepID=UPI0031018A06